MSHYGYDVEAVGILAEIVAGDEFLCRAAQDLLLLPVHEFPGLAEITGAAGLHFDKNERFPLNRDQVQLPVTVAMAPCQYIEALAQEKSAGDPFSPAAL